MIAGATAAAVSVATRAGLEAHHEMVALLHQMGALPSFIARAVVARPDLLIADEPTGNVDPEMGARLIRLIAELNRLGTTVLIATHDRALIEATRAREIRLVEGRLVELRTAL